MAADVFSKYFIFYVVFLLKNALLPKTISEIFEEILQIILRICGQSYVRKVVIGHMTCSGRNQARKSGVNRYSFSIPLWFALRHHFLWKKRCHVILGNNSICSFFDKKKTKKYYGAKLIC